MWVIFRDPKTPFNHLDKFVVEMVADTDILTYQAQLLATLGGRTYDIHRDVYFLQSFFTSSQEVDYFVRRYNPCLVLSPSK